MSQTPASGGSDGGRGEDSPAPQSPLPAPTSQSHEALLATRVDSLVMREIAEDLALIDPDPAEFEAATPSDPWAHRRGEPRVFAFFWTMYVLFAVAGSLTWVARFTTITASTYGPAARIMLVVVAVGMTVLWPMTRLSQATPRGHPVLSALLDLMVVQAPIQIVIWPLTILANWPHDIVFGLSTLLASWGVVTGGVVALGLSGRRAESFGDRGLWGRGGWMIVALLIAFGAVLGQWTFKAVGSPAPAWMTMSSPVTAIPALTGRGLSGPSAPVSRVQWDTMIGTLSLAVLLWSAAVARHGFQDRDSERA